MKRLLIWYWSATGGGGSQYAVNLAHRLSRRFGAGAIRLSLHANDPLLARARGFAFETRAAEVSTNRHKPLSTLLALGDSAGVLEEAARDCDAVLLPMNFASAAPLALGLNKPLVYFAHDPAPHPGDYAALGQRATQALLTACAVRVVAMSEYAARELERCGVTRRKIIIAPLSAVFAPRTASFQNDGPKHLLFAGRMMAYKGIDLLADALPLIDARADWRVTIAGEGPTLDDAMRARLCDERVEVRPGWMSEAALEDLIAVCDILLAPYRSATQSGVVAQALALGRPCVVTPVGALPEQIGSGRAGWIMTNVCAQSLASTLSEITASTWREKLQAAVSMSAQSWGHDYWGWLDEV
ncbi:glycosyltransferase family 4 protein [Vitreimonas sp.]|uniref:glycosyltransferase family 4 protein n=1 Tax=Vitreimonas sp. TaxID=3069702 RepID=UPI002EDA6E4A